MLDNRVQNNLSFVHDPSHPVRYAYMIFSGINPIFLKSYHSKLLLDYLVAKLFYILPYAI